LPFFLARRINRHLWLWVPAQGRDDQLCLTRPRAQHRHCERSEAIHGAANAVSEEWIASTEAAHLIGGLDVDRAQRANFERKVGESSKIISEVRLLPRSPTPKTKTAGSFDPAIQNSNPYS
jgi:hypothetical protein